MDGQTFGLTGAFTEYLRGTCNPSHQNCPPVRDPGEAPFFVRRSAPDVAGVFFPLEVLAVVHAKFDPQTATITVPVPLSAIQARQGSVISTPSEDNIRAHPAAYFAPSQAPQDAMTAMKSFVIPRRR